MKCFRLFFVLMIFISSNLYGQKNGQIINKTHIPRDSLLTQLSKLSNPERFVLADQEGLSFAQDWQFLDSLKLFAISYWSDGLKVKAYAIEPVKTGKYPCVIFNRGGNRSFGMLRPYRIALIAGKLASKGYVIIASNYRGVDGGEGMEEFGGNDVNDVLNLIPALGQMEKADTTKLGMYGWSRGGMMTYIALSKTNKIKAAVVGGAVSDSFESIRDRPEMETYVYSELVPNYKENKEEALFQRSAIKWPEKFPKTVPLLMMHGNSDWRVKAEQSLNLALQLEKHRVPYRLIIFEGADHGISEFDSEVDQQIILWFDRYLKKGVPLPNMEYHGR